MLSTKNNVNPKSLPFCAEHNGEKKFNHGHQLKSKTFRIATANSEPKDAETNVLSELIAKNKYEGSDSAFMKPGKFQLRSPNVRRIDLFLRKKAKTETVPGYQASSDFSFFLF